MEDAYECVEESKTQNKNSSQEINSSSGTDTSAAKPAPVLAGPHGNKVMPTTTAQVVLREKKRKKKSFFSKGFKCSVLWNLEFKCKNATSNDVIIANTMRKSFKLNFSYII